jgi:hypothetical protein
MEADPGGQKKSDPDSQHRKTIFFVDKEVLFTTTVLYIWNLMFRCDNIIFFCGGCSPGARGATGGPGSMM